MQSDFRAKTQRTKISANSLGRWITTIYGECPRCASHSLIKYVDDEVTIGCLGCGWKELDSIDYSTQKAIDNLKSTLERINRNRIALEYMIKVVGQYCEHVDCLSRTMQH